MIKGTKEVFESQASEYFKWIPKRKAYEQEESSKSLNILKKKKKNAQQSVWNNYRMNFSHVKKKLKIQ